jgi:hypothetical protein
LTPAQQSALAPLKRDWSGLDATRKQKWLEIAGRFPSMPPDERQRVQERMSDWSRMSPEERGRARLQYQEARKIDPQERQARWDAYLALPENERRALAKSAGTVPKAAQPAPPAAAGAATQMQKNNLVREAPQATGLKPVAPTLVQAKPGASTTLITKMPAPPEHAKAGEPKIAVSRDVVNRSTLLPKAGPQAEAAARPAQAGSSAR